VIVNISSIREERGATIPCAGFLEVNPADFEGLALKFKGPVAVRGKVTNTGSGFLLEAELNLDYQADCDRCLAETHQTQKIDIKEEFVSGRDISDETVYGFCGDLINLTECLRDQIILALPMKFLCSPECRGFCPKCGKNLNVEVCNCSEETMNHQFELVKNLLFTEGGGSSGKSKK
jgi:uncharacterized protein